MQIFYLDHNPVLAAQFLCDKHVNKMIIESAQLLANAYTEYELSLAPKTQKGKTRKHSYINHPCTKWTISSLYNFLWLNDHARALVEEKLYRTGKLHFTSEFIKWTHNNLPTLGVDDFDFPPQVFDEQYHRKDVVEGYRNYYVEVKLKNIKCVWTKRDMPSWCHAI